MSDTKYKILLVDDDKFMVDMYSLKFREAGFDVQTVFGAQEALDLLSSGEDFNVIITDLIMPVMDGFQLLEGIRKQKLVPNAALIVLSNQGQKSDIEKAEQYGVDGYIIKASTIPSEVLTSVIKVADSKFKK